MRFVALALLLGGCVADRSLAVQLVSNLAPGREVDAAHVTVIGASGASAGEVEISLSHFASLGRPTRLAELRGLAEGQHRITVTLLRAGVVVQTRHVTRMVSGTSAVTVLMTRDCNGVSCPSTADPSAVECLAGRCVSEGCDEEHPELCAMPACTSDAQCTASGVACAPARCSASGACFADPDDDACTGDEICDALGGCVAVDAPNDAALIDASAIDAGADGGSDGGTDAAAIDAGTCTGHVVGGECIANARQLDLDGDGYGDLVVGAPGGMSSAGRAFFYRGTPEGLVSAGVFTAGVVSDQLGHAVIYAGDTNGDGLDDVLVSGTTAPGQAYLFHGGPSFTTANAMITVPGTTALGAAMAGLGDIDHDGLGDVAISDAFSQHVHVFTGAATGLSHLVEIAPPGLAFLCGPGDLDGDGTGDLVVMGTPATEAMYVYLHPTADTSAPSEMLTSIDGSGLGYGPIGAGFVDGDMLGDLVVGAYQDNLHGRVYMYLDRDTGPRMFPDGIIEAPSGANGFGTIVAGVGDLDDSIGGDIAVVSDLAGATTVHLFESFAFGMPPVAQSIVLPAATGRTHLALGSADVDGDGRLELIVGDPKLGHVYVYAHPMTAPTMVGDLSEPGAVEYGIAIATR